MVDTCLLMQRQGLVVGTAGNVSIRTADLIAISPSGVPYEEMAPEDVVSSARTAHGSTAISNRHPSFRSI